MEITTPTTFYHLPYRHMTTLIDRIMNNQKMIQIVNQLQIGDDDIIRQILEAELTAVKGVDELIEKIINSIDVDGYDENGQSYSFSSTIRLELSKYIQDLKQTPVASKCTHIWYGTNAGYTDGKVVLKCRKCGIIYNNRQEDSNPKEVEIKRCDCKLGMNGCDICGRLSG